MDENIEKFDSIVNKVTAGEGISQDDATFLLQIIAGLNVNIKTSTHIVQLMAASITPFAELIARDVLRRCGRNDSKTRMSVVKTISGRVEEFWELIHQSMAANSTDDNSDTNLEGEQQ